MARIAFITLAGLLITACAPSDPIPGDNLRRSSSTVIVDDGDWDDGGDIGGGGDFGGGDF